MQDLREPLRNLLRPHLPYLQGRDISPTQDLTRLGLDSMRLVELLVGIEEHFDVRFPDELLRVETFATLETLTAAVEQLVED